MIVSSAEIASDLRSSPGSAVTVHKEKSMMETSGTPEGTDNFTMEIVRGQGGSGVQFFDLRNCHHFCVDGKLKSLVYGKP
jgi:hypothetical protein